MDDLRHRAQNGITIVETIEGHQLRNICIKENFTFYLQENDNKLDNNTLHKEE